MNIQNHVPEMAHARELGLELELELQLQPSQVQDIARKVKQIARRILDDDFNEPFDDDIEAGPAAPTARKPPAARKPQPAQCQHQAKLLRLMQNAVRKRQHDLLRLCLQKDPCHRNVLRPLLTTIIQTVDIGSFTMVVESGMDARTLGGMCNSRCHACSQHDAVHPKQACGKMTVLTELIRAVKDGVVECLAATSMLAVLMNTGFTDEANPVANKYEWQEYGEDVVHFTHMVTDTANAMLLHNMLIMCPKPNIKTKTHEQTCLMQTVVFNTPACFITLLEHNADATMVDIFGNTALHYAAMEGRNNMVTRLLKAKCDPWLLNHKQHAPIELALRRPVLSTLKCFLTHDQGLASQAARTGQTLLMTATHSNKAALVWLLHTRRVELDAVDNHHSTALHHCAAFGTPDMMGLLCKWGADPNRVDALGNTPLIIAIARCQPELVRVLSNCPATNLNLATTGQDANTGKWHTMTPIFHAVNLAGQHSIDHSNVQSMLHSLLQNRADPNNRGSEGELPLHCAIATSNPDVVITMLQAGADPTLVGSTFGTDAYDLCDAIRAKWHASGEGCSVSIDKIYNLVCTAGWRVQHQFDLRQASRWWKHWRSQGGTKAVAQRPCNEIHRQPVLRRFWKRLVASARLVVHPGQLCRLNWATQLVSLAKWRRAARATGLAVLDIVARRGAGYLAEALTTWRCQGAQLQQARSAARVATAFTLAATKLARKQASRKSLVVLRRHASRRRAVQQLHFCRVCEDEERNCLLQPCGHFGLCTTCALLMQQCPFCRVPIKSRDMVFVV